jgi:hypothetical protein
MKSYLSSLTTEHMGTKTQCDKWFCLSVKEWLIIWHVGVNNYGTNQHINCRVLFKNICENIRSVSVFIHLYSQ